MHRAGRVIGRKRKRAALGSNSVTLDQNRNISQMDATANNDDFDVLDVPPSKRLKTSHHISQPLANGSEGLFNASKPLKSNKNVAGAAGTAGATRVFGSNLTNLANLSNLNSQQGSYYLRSRSNANNGLKSSQNIVSKPEKKRVLVSVAENGKNGKIGGKNGKIVQKKGVKNVLTKNPSNSNKNVFGLPRPAARSISSKNNKKTTESSDEEEDIDIDIENAHSQPQSKPMHEFKSSLSQEVIMKSLNNNSNHNHNHSNSSSNNNIKHVKSQRGQPLLSSKNKNGANEKRDKKMKTFSNNSSSTSSSSFASSRGSRGARGAREGSRARTSNEENGVEPWDEFGADDDLECVEYCGDILENLKVSELKYCNFETSNQIRSRFVVKYNYDFMERQKDITEKMRLILLDWLTGVHRKFKLVPEVLYLSFNILDRFLAIENNGNKFDVSRNKLQLVGCTCLWIASKYHEIYAPEAGDFVYISDGAFTRDDLLAMEVKIMVSLNFRLTVPTPMTFAQRFIKIGTFEIEKQFVKYAEMMFDRFLASTAEKRDIGACVALNANDADGSQRLRKMYIKGICELLDNGFNRAMSKFGSVPQLSNGSKKKHNKFGLSVALQGVRSDIVDHIGNVLKMCEIVKHYKKQIEKTRRQQDSKDSKRSSRHGKIMDHAAFANITKWQQLIERIKKELNNKYGVQNEAGIDHIVAIKASMKDVLQKIDILCHLTYYLIEHGSLDYASGLSRILPSKLAAASIAYALLGCGILNKWPEYLAEATGYQLGELLPIMRKLEDARQNRKHKAIQSKYDREQFGRVSQMNFEKMNLKKIFDTHGNGQS